MISTCDGVDAHALRRAARAATHSRSGAKPSLAAYCSASRGVSRSTRAVASRIASTGKVSADGRPPASEMMPGRSVSFRISRITDGFIRSARRARRQGLWLVWASSCRSSRSAGAAGRPTGIARPTKTVAITASAKATVAASSRSPSTGTANSSDRNGCTSCTWLTRTVPPSARPRYQAKKPSHIENSVT